jgi:hypothetical protein
MTCHWRLQGFKLRQRHSWTNILVSYFSLLLQCPLNFIATRIKHSWICMVSLGIFLLLKGAAYNSIRMIWHLIMHPSAWKPGTWTLVMCLNSHDVWHLNDSNASRYTRCAMPRLVLSFLYIFFLLGLFLWNSVMADRWSLLISTTGLAFRTSRTAPVTDFSRLPSSLSAMAWWFIKL